MTVKAERKARRDRASTRKRGLTMIQCRVETRALLKQLAEKAEKTLVDYLAMLVEQTAKSEDLKVPETYETQQEQEYHTFKGDFRQTGRGKPKQGLEAFTFEGQEYHFRLLDTYNEKDLELLKSWDMQKRTAYAVWWDFKHPVESQKCNRHFMGEFEWENSFKRCSM